MPQKKITDLQLISSVSNSENFILDDGIQTYRATGSQLKTFCAGQELSVKTANYTIIQTDSIIVCNGTGGIFTVSLPSVASSIGKTFTIKKIDSSFNKITIATDGSDTIGASLTSMKLCTINESITISPFGGRWYVINHNTATPWIDFASVAAGTLITGDTVNPSYGTTTYNQAVWKREGDDMLIRWQYRQTSNGTSGTGQYGFNLESGHTIDTTKTKLGTIANGANHSPSLGYFQGGYDASNDTYKGILTPQSTTRLKVWLTLTDDTTDVNDSTAWSSTFAAFSVSPIGFSIICRIPITDWQSL